jgi:hypothetical protein
MCFEAVQTILFFSVRTIKPPCLPPLIRGVATAGGIVQSAETVFSA